ncbi:MAG TPA: methylated-DNA--[protein]-cysteine S-methyltransferase [Phycisphaerae bacterium]|nr:methylated-DNA--[protein]-cysteine S-methyltransferase [Phycisphaerae bacterium]
MTTRKPTKRELARARRARDASYDGVFWVCVKTTGIFCRPSCRARMPLERNVEYAFSPREALTRGYRPCKRCQPTRAPGAHPDWVQRVLQLSAEARDRRITDGELRSAGIDPVRARRYFVERFGMTFHAYHRAARMGAALDDLKGGTEPLATGLGRGYESDSGFRAAFSGKFKATPGRSRIVEQIKVEGMESPVGRFEIGATSRGVCLVEFADRRALPTELAQLEQRLKMPVVPGSNRFVAQMVDQLERYFAGELRDFTTELDITGTPFQRRVWAELMRIPYGQTISYGELARRVKLPGGQRAVGQANGANHIAIVIPCHRVVQSDGTLRGYGGGLWRKQHLLELEAAHASLFAGAAAAAQG